MRIIAGIYKGRRLSLAQSSIARPTTDRVKESMMSTLVSLTGGFENLSVCDAFAGSGALGFEALSRGASSVLWLDADRTTIKAITDFCQELGIERARGRAQVRDVVAFGIPALGGGFDLVFMDPPYDFPPEVVFEVIARAQEIHALSPGAIVVYEHDGRASADAIAALCENYGLQSISRKRYGKTYLDYLGA